MSKRKIILIAVVGLLVVGVGGFLGWRKINNQKATNNNQQTITKMQNAIDNEQQVIDNSQNTTDSKQESANNNQNSTSNIQNTTDNKQQAVTSNQNIKDDTQNTITKTQQATAGKIVSRLASWGFQKSSGRKIDTIILHTSYDALGNDPFNVSGVIAEYKQAQVSPHYLIARDGTIYQLVSDQNIAWHAGVAKMPDGRTDVNSFSIGVEIINTQDGKFTSDQYAAVNRLISNFKNEYPIKNILGHSDIAPGRKTDPWGIEWKKIDK